MHRTDVAFSFNEILNKKQLNNIKRQKSGVFEHENPNTSSFHILKHFLRKYNHHHDPETGRFTSGAGSSGGTMATSRKERQLAIIQNSNPMQDDYHTGIRSTSDILSAKEAFGNEDEFAGTPDWTYEDAQNALSDGKVTLYSSYPIENGVFVTPSKMMAQDYAGGGDVYSITAPVDNVAWIDDTEGQYASDESITKYNHHHDPETGRFTSGDGSSSKTKHPMERTRPAPTKTLKAYKVFVVKDGKLYPPMVANPNASDTPVGVWLDASEGTKAPDSKTGRPQVKAGGKGTQGGSGSLAYRPGWHLGEYPEAKQFARKNPENGKKELFPENFVWAECDIAADFNYQDEAMSYGYNKNGKFQHSLAGLPKLPTDGYYTYRTNPDPTTQPWYITGSMKVNRLLTDAETNQILRDRGITPMKRKGGELDPKALGLDESLFTVKKSRVEKYNHNHDPETGRFTSGGGSSGSWSNTLASEKERVLGLKRNRQAEYLYDNSADTYDNCVEAMRNGTTESLLNEYFNIMESNGDPTPTKPLASNNSHNRNKDVESGKYSSHDEAKASYVAEDTGMSLADAKIAVKEIEKWTSGGMNGDRQILDDFVDKAPVYDGQIYRGLKFTDEDYSSFMSDIEKGSIISMNNMNSSWSSDKDVAMMYANHVYDDANSVVITCAKNRTSAPVEHLTIHSGEREVLASSKASWTVLHYEVRETSAGKHKAYITVVERGEGR